MRHLSNKSEVREFGLSLQIALAIFGAALLIFSARLWYLQLFKGEEYRRYADEIATRKVPKPAPRGMVFDTTGQRLADNRASFDLKVTPESVRDEEALFQRLSELIGMPIADIRKAYAAGKAYSAYQPALLKSDLSWPEVAAIESFKADLQGVEIETSIKRTYIYGDLFAHQIGYLGEVGELELPKLQKKFKEQYGDDYYVRGHFWGKYGVEQKWEQHLKGIDGKRIAAKDRRGRELSMEEAGRLLQDFRSLALGGKEEIPGNNVRLSIDLGLQQHIAKAFGEQSGAVVVMDVNTGLIRAMFNHPAFDPEIFARGIRHAEWDALSNHPDHPLEDKAIRGMYPPGSTYKLFTAAAALELGLVTPKTTYTCTGQIRFGNRPYRCWNKNGHGVVDLKKSIQQSCDTYFYNVGLKVGVDRLAEYAKSFGLGSPTGIGINNEKGGLIPTSEWKRVARREEWQEGETLSIAIGQGFDLVTPLQLAVSYAALANGGKVLEPRLVEQVVGPDGKVVSGFEPKVVKQAKISPANLKLLQEGLYSVVNEPGGTAYRTVRLDEIAISGKTGTAQVVAQTERNQKFDDKRFHDHAWFASYAPHENPQIAIAVLVEHGEHGSSAAGPIAKAVAEYWFRNEIAAKRAEKGDKKVALVKPVATPSSTPVPGPVNAPEPVGASDVVPPTVAAPEGVAAPTETPIEDLPAPPEAPAPGGE